MFESHPIQEVKGTILLLMQVFTYKLNSNRYLLKYKARIIVYEDLQVLQPQDTYTTTLAVRVFQALMLITAYFDTINVFTNTYINDVIYVKYPDGFESPRYCQRLLQALYRLLCSLLLWFKDLSNILQKLGLLPIPKASYLFTNDKLIVFFYIDDIIVLCYPLHQRAYKEFKTHLLKAYNIRDIRELKQFLGIRVIQDRSKYKIWLYQDSYINKVLV